MSWSIYKKGESRKVAQAIKDYVPTMDAMENAHIEAAKVVAVDMIVRLEEARVGPPPAGGGQPLRRVDAGPVYVDVSMSGSEGSSYDNTCSIKVVMLDILV